MSKYMSYRDWREGNETFARMTRENNNLRFENEMLKHKCAEKERDVNRYRELLYECQFHNPNKGVTIEKVHFNNPVTCVIWSDGTKTLVRTQNEDVYDPEKGLAIAIAKKALGNTSAYYNVFKQWVDDD